MNIKNYKPKLAHRYQTMTKAVDIFLNMGGLVKELRIVETGMSRIENNWQGDGMSTLFFADLAKTIGCYFDSVDIHPDHVASTEKWLIEAGLFTDRISLSCGDSVEFLRDYNNPISLLYLDSMDFCTTADPNPPQDHAVNEYLAVKDKLVDNAVILIDDCQLPHGGKGGKLVPLLKEEGWIPVMEFYQVLFRR